MLTSPAALRAAARTPLGLRSAAAGDARVVGSTTSISHGTSRGLPWATFVGLPAGALAPREEARARAWIPRRRKRSAAESLAGWASPSISWAISQNASIHGEPSGSRSAAS